MKKHSAIEIVALAAYPPEREIKWLKAMVKDEHAAHKDYLRHDYPNIAKDEFRHEGIMRKALKRVS